MSTYGVVTLKYDVHCVRFFFHTPTNCSLVLCAQHARTPTKRNYGDAHTAAGGQQNIELTEELARSAQI